MLHIMQSTELIGTREVASIFGVDSSTVTRWAQAGKIDAVVETPIYLFDRAYVEKMARA